MTYNIELLLLRPSANTENIAIEYAVKFYGNENGSIQLDSA